MKITLMCSCGLLLEQDEQQLLIDAPNGELLPFTRCPEDVTRAVLAGEKPFDNLQGVLFTHLHPDHYDTAAVGALLGLHRVQAFLPSWEDAEEVQMTAGAFSVRAVRVPHVPAPKFPEVAQYALLVATGEKSVYITADATPDAERHLQILGGCKVDAAFWNSQVLSYPACRAMLSECAKWNYIYHMPIDPADVTGIRRKCERNMVRFGNELKNVSVLEEYPFEIELE